MCQNNISDLDLDKEFTELKKRGYVSVKCESKPNFYISSLFANTIQFVQIIESSFILPVVKELEKNPKYRDYKNLRDIIQLGTLYALE